MNVILENLHALVYEFIEVKAWMGEGLGSGCLEETDNSLWLGWWNNCRTLNTFFKYPNSNPLSKWLLACA